MLQEAFNHFINIPASSWYHAAEWVVGLPFVSAVMLAIVHFYNKFRDNPLTSILKTVYTCLIGFLIAAYNGYASGGITPQSLGEHGFAIIGGLTAAYKFINSPLYKKYVLKLEKAETTDKPTNETVLAPDAPLAQGFEG